MTTHATKHEWTIWNTGGNYPLISVGGRAANEERLADLEREMPGQFYLVRREIGPWARCESSLASQSVT